MNSRRRSCCLKFSGPDLSTEIYAPEATNVVVVVVAVAVASLPDVRIWRRCKRETCSKCACMQHGSTAPSKFLSN